LSIGLIPAHCWAVPFPVAVYSIWFSVGLAALLIQLVALHASKVRIEEFHFFYGRSLGKFDFGNLQLHVGWIPMGCFGKYDIHQFSLLPTVARVGLLLLPSVILLGLGLVLLGPEAGWHHFVTGFRQMVEAIPHPQAVGYVLVEKLHALYRQSPMAMVGVICMKWVAWSLLPIGHVMGPALMQIFSPALRPNERAEKLITMGMIIGFLMSLVWMGLFLVYAVTHWTA
jgi:hypothetical protein